MESTFLSTSQHFSSEGRGKISELRGGDFPSHDWFLLERFLTRLKRPIMEEEVQRLTGNDQLSTNKRKERCSGSYRQAVGFLVIKDDSISERPS
jgi:hypothetical protein